MNFKGMRRSHFHDKSDFPFTIYDPVLARARYLYPRNPIQQPHLRSDYNYGNVASGQVSPFTISFFTNRRT